MIVKNEKLIPILIILISVSAFFICCQSESDPPPPPPEKVVVSDVTGLEALGGYKTIILRWNNPDSKFFYGCEISSSPNSGSLYTSQIVDRFQDSYASLNMVNGLEFTITVKAIFKDKDNNTLLSNGVSVRCTPEGVEPISKYSVGDIIMSDGSVQKASTFEMPAPESHIVPVAIIFATNFIGTNKGSNAVSARTLGVGLYKLDSIPVAWCHKDAYGASRSINSIIGTRNGGDMDGRDNLTQVGFFDINGYREKDKYYPALSKCDAYGQRFLSGYAEYRNGWYLPSIAELVELYKNKSIVDNSFDAIYVFKETSKEFKIYTHSYWSSSQSPYAAERCFYMDCETGNMYDLEKTKKDKNYARAVREFTD